MKALKYSLFFVGILIFFQACDTSNNIDAPVKSYFLKYFGNDGDQEGIDFVIDLQGFFYLLGNTSSQVSATGSRNGNGQQLYLVKSDPDGQVVWEKSFGGSLKDEARDIEFAGIGRLIIVGNTEVAPGDNDIFLLTVDLDGNKLDSAVYGFKNYNEDASTITQITTGFMVAGATTNPALKPSSPGPPTTDANDAMQLRFFDTLDPDTLTWRQTNGTAQSDVSIKIFQVTPTPASPAEFYVFGYSNKSNLGDSNDDYNFWYYGIGKDGEPSNQDWTLGSPVDDEKLSSVGSSPIQSGDGYILAGSTVGSGGTHDIYIAKMRKSLNFSIQDVQFSKPLSATLDQLSPQFEKVSVYPSVSSGYLILANENTQGQNNFYLTKIGNDGGLSWGPAPYFIFGGANDDYIGAVDELPDGRIVLLGTMEIGDEGQKKMTLIKVNPAGKFTD